MNKKMHIFLIVVLAINTLRYGSYLLEGDTHIYYFIMFLANLLAMLFAIFSRNRIKRETDNAMEESR
ncbi:hypothetical protein [Planococcus maritimus]|uniref:hypothetical protein n=1 Tax=Planococcus maritimus TaxID=192421 RepID=UPI000799980A|nr:hypothetical protein [Planococcus maritimus]KYG59959.1 hypothetical protein AY633_06915 [Planococcus maritimus]